MSSIEAKYAYMSTYLTERRKHLIEEISALRTRHITVAVEDVDKERNAAALVRTAECLGIQNMHIIENNTKYKLSRGIAKGADKWMDIDIYDTAQEESNTVHCIKALKTQGYKVVACSPHKEDTTPLDISLDQPIALVFGGELEGLSQEAFNQADAFLKIPIYGFTESYNLSVSAGIILSNLIFRLEQSDLDWRLSSEEQLELKLQWTMKTVQNAEAILNRWENNSNK